MKTYFIFLIVLCLLSQTIYGQTPVPAGDVSGTWKLDGSPYLIEGDITVPESKVLEIEAGVIVQFQGYYRLLVLGKLLAIGEETDSIRFTPLDTTIGWRHIYLMSDGSNTDTSKLYYCIVEYGKPTGEANPGENTGGGISIEEANVIISHCLIQHNYCSGSNPISPPIGGGICVAFSDPIIEYCTIINNQAESNGGAIGLAKGCNPTITNCTLSSNSTQSEGGGITTLDFSAFTMINTIIEGSLGGSGIYFENPDLVSIDISYCCFHNNDGGSFTGEGPVGLGFVIFTNNNGDSCDMYHNIYYDPLFADPVEGDFHLGEGSPCIDAGDPEFQYDPDGSICEVGAYYFPQTGFHIEENFADNKLKCYPNPFSTRVTIEYEKAQPGISIIVINHLGQIVESVGQGYSQAVNQQYVWNALGMPAGIYFVQVRAGNEVTTRKMIKQ